MDVQGEINNAIGASLMSAGIWIVISLAISIVVIVLVSRYVRKMSGADLRAAGVPAQARVLKLWDTGTTINDNPLAGLLLEVQPVGQATYQVETKSLIPRLAVGAIQPGATINVKIDPSNRQRVAIDFS